MQTNKVVILFILFTSNNIICSVTNLKGDVIAWSSAGSQKSKGLKKLIPTVIHATLLKITSVLLKKNLKQIHLKMRGVSKHKKTVLKTIIQVNIKILSLQDITSKPHNGCRPQKCRRL